MADARSVALRAAAGALAVGAGVAVQALAHELQPEAATAPTALAQGVIAALPGQLAGPLITLLGYWAMRLLVAGSVLAFLVVGAAAGLWPRLAAPLLVVPWTLGPLGVLALPALAGELGPTALSAALAAAVAWLGRPRVGAQVTLDPRRRRILVGGTALVALAGLAATRVQSAARLARSLIAGTPLALARPPSAAAAPSPADDSPAVASSALAPDVTSNADFYVVDEAIIDPAVDVDAWRLSIGGLVRDGYSLGYDELLELPAVEQYQTLECIGNGVGGPLVSNALWVGVPVRDLIERAGDAGDGVVKVIFRSVDGYASAIPLELALAPTTLVAFGMNGHALPREHGFPARLLIPGRYGMKNVKWLGAIEPTTEDYLGFWEQRGWSDEAIVHTMSRLDLPTSIQDVRAGEATVIAGIAYAGSRGVSRVEISLDGGKTWRDTQLGRKYSTFTWRRWAYPWTPEKGFYQLRVRAYDDRGVLQPEDEQEALPLGATGIHGYQVEVR